MGKHVKDGPEAKVREALADLHRSIYLLYEAAGMYGDRGGGLPEGRRLPVGH